MKYGTVKYYGAKLEVPDFLVPLFPVNLPAKKWPTFCGSGGWGDKCIPDIIWGVHMQPACFTHDIDWAVTPNKLSQFSKTNWRFLKNCLALINASDLWAIPLILARSRCLLYFAGVSTFGVFAFLTSHTVPFDETNPFKHPTVRSRLKRLAYADIGLADIIAQNGDYNAVG
jgi:hypothetical protein